VVSFPDLLVVTQFVSERELAETYEDGWETVTQYRKAHRLRENNPGMARAEIARRVGRPSSGIRAWLAEGKTPAVISAIRTARECGWLDVDPDTERFRAFNQLVAWIFSGGGISVDTFAPHFSVDDSLMLAVLAQHFRWLQLDYRCRHLDDPERHLEVVPSDNGVILGRILSVLGAPRGVKVQMDDLSLPSYLSTVDREHRRDFARIHLLNRTNNPEQAGAYIHSIRSETHARDLRELFVSATSGSATVGSQSRVWVSAAAVCDLAGINLDDRARDPEHESPDDSDRKRTTEQERAHIRPGLATAALYGSHTPPTARAIASTFRRTKTPGGHHYHQCYQAARDRDASRATLADDLGVPESSIQSWRRGSRPYATRALEQARARGWCEPPADSETATALTTLLTWLLARGSLRETYYPVFGATTTAQRERFDAVAATLSLSYETVRPDDPSWPTELRPTEDGSLLGRVLYALGAPRLGEPQTAAPIPAIAYHSTRHAQQVADVWCLHHAEMSEHGDTTVPFTITVPPRAGEYFPDALANVLSEQLHWTLEQTDGRELVVIDRPDDSIV
jgi:hypothetical protein